MATATPVQPLGAKTPLALAYTAADATGNRLKSYDGSADYTLNSGLLLFIKNSSGVSVTATLSDAHGFFESAPPMVVPAGASMVFGPIGGLGGGSVDINWSAATSVSVAAVDGATLGRSIALGTSVTSVDTTTDVVTIAWALSIEGITRPFPSWATFDLLWRKVNNLALPDAVADNIITTIPGVTSPYAHQRTGTGGHGLDLLASGGTPGRLYYWVLMRDPAGTGVGGSSITSRDISHV